MLDSEAYEHELANPPGGSQDHDSSVIDDATENSNEPAPSVPLPPILDVDNWQAWLDKYVDPLLQRREWELLTDEVGPNILEFPMFTERFCKEFIELSESVDQWTEGRHRYYPTHDMLLETLGFDYIHQYLLREYVYPLAMTMYQLDGDEWLHMNAENFIIRYRPDKQGHLSLHHDASTLSLNLRLNEDFEGGGTYFPKYKLCLHPRRVGNALLHPGMITHRHGARPVRSGTRYIVVSFIRK
ncbi:MAG: 2OG-Fe(II) oxygenase family protein [Thiotrichales bacterium]